MNPGHDSRGRVARQASRQAGGAGQNIPKKPGRPLACAKGPYPGHIAKRHDKDARFTRLLTLEKVNVSKYLPCKGLQKDRTSHNIYYPTFNPSAFVKRCHAMVYDLQRTRKSDQVFRYPRFGVPPGVSATHPLKHNAQRFLKPVTCNPPTKTKIPGTYYM